MSEEFVEGATTPEAELEKPVEQTPVTEAELANWVGEDRKYKTVDDLAKAYGNADKHILELELETKRLRDENLEVTSKSRSVEEILEALKNENTPSEPHISSQPVPKQEEVDWDALLETKLSERDKATKQKEAVTSTWQIMDEAFGDRSAASVAVTQYINDDPGRKAVVNSLAISDPAGLLKLLGKDVMKKPVAFAESKGSSGGEHVNLEATLTWDVAHTIRKKDPKLYYSHAFRKRMQTELPTK